MTLGLQVKLASIVVHVEEATGEGGHELDLQAAAKLASDPEVRAWLDSLDPVFLPRKRSSDG